MGRRFMDIQTQLQQLQQRLGEITDEVAQLAVSVIEPEGQEDKVDNIATLAGYLALSPEPGSNELLNSVLACAMEVVGAKGAGLTLLDPDTNALVFRAAIGDGAEGIIGYQVPLQGSQHGLAFATGEVQASSPLNSDIEASANAVFRNVLVAPLMVDDDPVGTISAVNKEGADHFTAEDMQAYRRFADLAAVVVRQNQRENAFSASLEGSSKSGSADYTLAESDRQLLQLVRQLAAINRQRPDQLEMCAQLITLLQGNK